MSLQISWINKPGGSYNPHTHITQVGGNNWSKWSREVILDILSGQETYYVFQEGQLAEVGLGILNGSYYLRTRSDGTPLDNLLSLVNISQS